MGQMTIRQFENLPKYAQDALLEKDRLIRDLTNDIERATRSPIEYPVTNICVPKFRDPLGWEPSAHERVRVMLGPDPQCDWVEVGRSRNPNHAHDTVTMDIYASRSIAFMPSSSNWGYLKLLR